MIDAMGERTLNDLFSERRSLVGESDFLIFENADGQITHYTYEEFGRLVERCAVGLHERGLGKGDHVVAHLKNCPEVMILWFGCARLGVVFVPSNVANTSPEIEHIVGFTEAKIVVTQADLRGPVDSAIANLGSSTEVLVARDGSSGAGSFDGLLGTNSGLPEVDVVSDDVAELIFTSGTTAKPKAVMLTHANCVKAGLDSVQNFWLGTGERCLTSLPLFHVNAQAISALGALTTGGTLILLEEFRASRFWKQVRDHRATHTAIVAMQLRTMLAQPVDPDERNHDLKRVFYAINVTDEEKDEFEERFAVRLLNGFGQTEAMTLICCSPAIGPRHWPSVGLPAAGRNVYIVDEKGEEVLPGEVGEITISGTPGRDFMLGYYKDPEATGKAIVSGLLRTGDNAYCDGNGYIFFVDRKKDMIKRAGENISAAEVETVLLQHPEIDEAAVVGVPDSIRDEQVSALIVSSNSELSVEAVIEHCESSLSRFKVPTVVAFTEGLPKTSVGKVKKADVRKILREM